MRKGGLRFTKELQLAALVVTSEVSESNMVSANAIKEMQATELEATTSVELV